MLAGKFEVAPQNYRTDLPTDKSCIDAEAKTYVTNKPNIKTLKIWMLKKKISSCTPIAYEIPCRRHHSLLFLSEKETLKY